MAAYYSLMVESASILGADRSEAEAQMLDVLNFEIQLANVSTMALIIIHLIKSDEWPRATIKGDVIAIIINSHPFSIYFHLPRNIIIN